MPLEGALHIDLAVDGGLFSRVAVRNQRLLTATRPLAGRPVDEVPNLVSRLFSVCRIAQGVASLEAVERARGLAAPPEVAAARRFLVDGETVLEHAGRICLDWTARLGETPAIAPLKTLRGVLVDLHRQVFPAGDWTRLGGGAPRIDGTALTSALGVVARSLDELVFGGVAPADGRDWAAWMVAGRTVAARLAFRLGADGLSGFGACDVAPLPQFDPARLDARLMADATGAFIERPDWDGLLHHTGPLARRWAHPLVVDVVRGFGAGLLAQIAARVAELAVLLREMQDFAQGLCNDNSSQAPLSRRRGLAVIEAARGRLVHRVETDGDVVVRYQILAPTEWNFHPAGAFVQGLLGRPAGTDPKGRVELLVALLDPCVACRIEGP